MKKDLTWIINILDESGSMSDVKSDTVGAYNNFINDQKNVEGIAECFLVKFNTKIEKVYEKINIQEVSLLNTDTYKPSSYTRLYDAIGYTIKDVKSNIKSLNENEKPDKIIFIITTDGKENRSVDFSKEKIIEKIEKCKSKGYEFIYLGANQDAMEEGGKMGVSATNTATWTADSRGINVAFMASSNYASKFRNAKTSADYSALNLQQEYKDADQTTL